MNWPACFRTKGLVNRPDADWADVLAVYVLALTPLFFTHDPYVDQCLFCHSDNRVFR
jgi:hypothetical protein